MIRTAASLTGLTAAFVLVLYLTSGGESGGDPSTSATPTPFVAATPTATATKTSPPLPSPTLAPLPPVLVDTEVISLEFSGEIDFPIDAALILETGCWQCDGPTTGLRRMYRDPAGEIRIERILSIDQLDIPLKVIETDKGPEDYRPYITGYAIAPDASEMLVSICIDPGCPNGLIAWGPDGRSAIYRSLDGGVTWNKVVEYDRGLSIRGFVGPGQALVAWQEAASGPLLFALFPGFEPVEPPESDLHPVLMTNGQIMWASYEQPWQVLRSDGSVFLDFGEGSHVLTRSVTNSTSEGVLAIPWSWRPEPESGFASSQEFLTLVGEDGTLHVTYRSRFMFGGVWSGEGQLVASADVGLNEFDAPVPVPFLGIAPVVADLKKRSISVIAEHLRLPGYVPQRDIVHAVQTGPFARVVNTGSCLNIRESPGLHAAILTCAADDVLLRTSGPAFSGVDTAWLTVTAPDGTSGWAATEFLE